VIIPARQVKDVHPFEACCPIIAKIICTFIDTFLCVRKNVFAIIGLNDQVRPLATLNWRAWIANYG
jgi:hypothetical protein